MAPKDLSYFTYNNVALPKPPEKLEQCATDLETTAWIIDQLRQCGWNQTRGIVTASPVGHYHLYFLS